MTGSPTTRLAAAVALSEQAADYALAGLTDVTLHDLDRPTPCAGWDLGTVLRHVADATDALTDLVGTGRLVLGAQPRRDEDVVAAARERTRVLLEALAGAPAGRRDPGDRIRWATEAAHGGAIELAVHGWDIRAARGADREIPAGLAGELIALTRSLVTDDARGPAFGLPVQVPETASPSDRLVAFLGRHPTHVPAAVTA